VHDYTRSEIAAGVFVVFGLAVLGYLSISVGGITIVAPKSYRVRARFSNVGDLKQRAPVKVAGVTIGKVGSVQLANYFGEAELVIDRKVTLPKDTIASIATAGLLGESFVSLSPGGSEANLADGDSISHTESAVNVVDLIGRYAFGNAGQGTGDKADASDKTDERAPAAAPRRRERSPQPQLRKEQPR
jgi:phospholipid/cholesterol/gamma-HCH transport system substrate-binding protein